MQGYRLTDEQFLSLAKGEGSPDAIGLLADAQLSRRRLFLLATLERLEFLPAGLRDVFSLMIEIDRTHPPAGRDLLRYPFLDAWFRQLVPAFSGAAVVGRAAERLGALAVATAISAGMDFEIVLTCGGPDLMLPGVGIAVGVGPGRVPVCCDGEAVTIAGRFRLPVPCAEVRPGWQPAHYVQLNDHQIEVIDADPLRDRFPERPLDSLSTAQAARLDGLMVEAWHLLEEEQPAHAEAMRVALRGLVPLRAPSRGTQISASVRGCFGAIGLSIPDDPQTLAEVLVHEFQHEKLGALLDLVDLCAGGGRARLHAPWRPDPRPVAALMQGVYAFAGVAGFWRARRAHLTGSASEAADFHYFSWRDHVHYGLDQLLCSGELTPQGHRFFEALSGAIAAWRAETATPRAVRLFTAATHMSWRLAHHRPQPADVKAFAAAWPGKLPLPGLPAMPAVAAGAVSTELVHFLETQALSGRVIRGDATTAERALLRGDGASALRLVPAPCGDREWLLAIVALFSMMGETGMAFERPDLFRAVFDRLEQEGHRPELTTLHAWLTELPTQG